MFFFEYLRHFAPSRYTTVASACGAAVMRAVGLEAECDVIFRQSEQVSSCLAVRVLRRTESAVADLMKLETIA